MDIDTYENEMICQTVDDATLSATHSGQTSQLAIRVIKNIRDDVEKHSDQIDGKSLIEIKMARDNTEHSANESD